MATCLEIPSFYPTGKELTNEYCPALNRKVQIRKDNGKIVSCSNRFMGLQTKADKRSCWKSDTCLLNNKLLEAVAK